MNANTRRRLEKHRKEVKREHRSGATQSVGVEKNVTMEVLHNVGEDGKKVSVTVFKATKDTKPQYRREFKPTHERIMGRD